ncbi:MAG TPA: VOC family protein [Roseiflexaceae bacterium]|nr:VOC family protein [Roseiflexaceae bacterium]
MQLLHAIPALPVREIGRRLAFYCETLGFTLVHHEGGFAILRRDAVELHLWEAGDETWRTREGGAPPVVSGGESFIAGTASCRIAVAGVDALHAEVSPHGVIHPNAPLADQPWGTREFGVLDPDNNLITFFERVR